MLVSLTLGASAERLNSGCASPGIQETASSVFHVVSGTGRSVVNGKSMEWKQGDTFCIPAWNHYQHIAHDTSYLYRLHDLPQLKALGLYRVAGADEESYVV